MPVWNRAPAWGRPRVSAAAAFVIFAVQVREKRRAVSSRPRSSTSRGAADLWRPPLALVACCDTARLKSPRILLFRPLCVDPISASSVAASFSEPPSLISVSTPQPVSISFAISLFFVESVFSARTTAFYLHCIIGEKKKGRLISAVGQVCRASLLTQQQNGTMKWAKHAQMTQFLSGKVAIPIVSIIQPWAPKTTRVAADSPQM